MVVVLSFIFLTDRTYSIASYFLTVTRDSVLSEILLVKTNLTSDYLVKISVLKRVT